MTYEQLWLRAFALTVVIEAPIYTLMLRRGMRTLLATILLAIGLQVVTHPALWFVAPRFEPYWAWVTVMELLVWLVEGLIAGAVITHPKGRRHALLWGLFASLCANGVSTAIGLLIH